MYINVKSVCCSFVYLCDLIWFVRIEDDGKVLKMVLKNIKLEVLISADMRFLFQDWGTNRKRQWKRKNVWIKRLNSQISHSSDVPHVFGSFYSMFVVFHHMTRRRRRDGVDAIDGKTRRVENWCVSTLHSRASHKYPLLPSKERKQRFFQMCQWNEDWFSLSAHSLQQRR